ncbi:MAG: HNH endonuclease [Spirochaetota bacterium]|jgi:hypothetical protein|nr:HNH endonuclease [Spirochaetota bacterium]
MKIERKQITIRELVNGYQEKGQNGIEGVVAYGGKLDVRPAYQREYIYSGKDRDEVIRSVMKGFPVNVMYWSKADGEHYELMDGQQRTISICRYAAESERTFSVDYRYFFNLEQDEQSAMFDYVLDIYVCDGTPSEVLAWFRVINIAGVRLSEQELRNTAYTGTWLSDAKVHLSKPNCAAQNMARDYMNGSPIRQEYLETAIQWIAARDGLNTIEEYMALHQNDENANQIWMYFKRVIDWAQAVFPVKRKEMKGVEWGHLYNRYKDAELDPDKLEQRIAPLMRDDDITNKKGIYDYVLTGVEKNLSIRVFTENQKRETYERQGGICVKCKKHFDLQEMEADHIKPWSKGGKTISENCQMLCLDCNRRKSDV